MPAKKKLWIFQRQLANYRLPVFKALSEKTNLTILHTSKASNNGFTARHSESQPVDYSCYHIHSGLSHFLDPIVGMRILFMAKKHQPDKMIIVGDTRYLSFWIILIGTKILGIESYIHGHALLKKKANPFFIKQLYRAVYTTVIQLCSGYIAYTKEVKNSFSLFNINDQNVKIADNSLINPNPLSPSEKIPLHPGILFCGRLRDNHGLDALIAAIEQIRHRDHLPVELHIIGGGKDAARIQQKTSKMPWVHRYGTVYDSHQISEISTECSLGCYPGNAGLSIVQYMSLSLVPVTHDHIRSHGPEASYIKDGINGILFDRDHATQSLADKLSDLLRNPEKTHRLQQNAFNTYQELITPPLSTRLLHAIGL